jgi:hypothetical protein
LTGWGGYGDETDEALDGLAGTVATGSRRPAHRERLFDLTAVAQPAQPDSVKQVIVRLRGLGAGSCSSSRH